jgi:hypothetical protein
MQHVWQALRLFISSSFSSESHATQEQYTGVIDLEDDDPVPVEIMLKYFYTGKYNEPISEIKDLRPQLQVQVLTYNLADKYDVPALMALAGKRFKSTLNEGPTPEEYLSAISESADLEILRATMLDVPEFAFDVLRLFAKAPLIGHCHFCGPNQSAEALQARCIKCGKGGISLTH